MRDHSDIKTYLQYSQQERLRTVHEILQDLKETISLNSDTSPAELLDSLSSVLSATITNELCVHAHGTALLMMQYLKQHPSLKADIPKLEDKVGLEEMARYERELFENAVASPPVKVEVMQHVVAKAEPAPVKDNTKEISKITARYDAQISGLKQQIHRLEQDLRLRLSDSNPVIKLREMLEDKNKRISQLERVIQE
jgi:hypothetical protein